MNIRPCPALEFHALLDDARQQSSRHFELAVCSAGNSFIRDCFQWCEDALYHFPWHVHAATPQQIAEADALQSCMLTKSMQISQNNSTR
jgi:hypothetical protein